MADKLRILIVDDNEDVRILSSTWLKELYSVDTAIDGNDCLKKIKKTKYDIIFLDVMMPGPKPQELVDAITKVLPKIMIIYMTAVEMFNPTQNQEKQGFMPVITSVIKGYLIKPIDKTQLINKINEVLKLETLRNKLNKKLKDTKTKKK